ncbi:MAG: aldehyde ferredoxin oxidoreductase family protein [Dehalococcoidales bacterium]|nr:aldehyde ferredoxin oxidoreductase family protein [Dehalococcoidales bacterium]
MARGYMGKMLWVDLSGGKLKDEKLDEKLARRYIGGYGIGARVLFDRMKAGADPLGPENILGFTTGPLTGTPALSGTRYTVVGKSPLTGGWGDANSGGWFGAFLKFSGYDAVFFKGIAEKPVYLFIDNGRAELKDASRLWGEDTYATEDMIKAEHGKDTVIACIGPGGEKMSRIAAIVHLKGSVAARSGLGTVMGSKRLKAVAVKGNMKVPVADEKGLKETRARYLATMGGHVDILRKYGTTFTTVPSIESGDSPVKNWDGVAVKDFPDASPIGAEAVAERSQKRIACYQCPVGCEAIMKAGNGEYKWEAGSYRPEYETIVMLGSNCLNNNIESIIKANDVCNRLGIDTISAGAVIAFAMECYEKGIITRKDTGGIELTWGNHKAVVALTEQIGRREGIGDILADGVKIAAQKIGKGAEECAMHVGGQEVPAHNPIATPALTATYLTNATPARHTQGSEEHHNPGLLPEFNQSLYSGRGEAHARGSNFQHALMCSGYCLFVNSAFPTADVIADFIRPVTGWDVTTDDLVETGERIENMRQAFNLREGIKISQFKLAGRLLGKPPQQAGPTAGVTVDEATLVKDYLKAMGWDEKTGKPSRKRMEELGLGDVAKELKL